METVLIILALSVAPYIYDASDQEEVPVDTTEARASNVSYWT